MILFLAVRLAAQPNVPVKLALITESAAAQPAADLLTASFSTNASIQLLERDQIEKVHHEQALAVANKEYLKLGQLLGADGLLLVKIATTPQGKVLTTRLVAVKPGVILNTENYDLPIAEPVPWANFAARRLAGFLPKLAVLPKEAIPLSVVNLRSAITTPAGADTETELKRLLIQRLTKERQIFVTEREKLTAAAEEKGLAADDSAFWDGSYLLAGTVDQHGYSQETITINAQLTPPKGGTPVTLEVSGSRTNLTAVINALALKVVAALSVQPTATQWSPDDEAAQYLAEAQWALKCGAYAEAQVAADSAWALGRRDLEGALLRTKAWLRELEERYDAHQQIMEAFPTAGGSIFQPGGAEPAFRPELTRHLPGLNKAGNGYAGVWPDARDIDRATRALSAYYEFCRASPDGEPKVLWRGPGYNDWHDSEWYLLGVENLSAAGQVLQQFYFAPEKQIPVADKLEDLRALARSVADLIARAPSIHDDYYVGDRIATSDELSYTAGRNTNIFRCEVNWGCFWQETPEAGVALYRELMESPVFSYIHVNLWLRERARPRLVAWQESDRQRIPVVWRNFTDELERSTNVLLQLEARALTMAAANDDATLGQAFTNLFDAVWDNRDVLVKNNVDVTDSQWGLYDLVMAKTAYSRQGDPACRNVLEHQFRADWYPKLKQMNREYWEKTVPARRKAPAPEQQKPILQAQKPMDVSSQPKPIPNSTPAPAQGGEVPPLEQSTFEQQKQFLREQKPFDVSVFLKLFQNNHYNQAQARELFPLEKSYNAALIAQARATTEPAQMAALRQAILYTTMLEDRLLAFMNPSGLASLPAPKRSVSREGGTDNNPAVMPATNTAASDSVTNIITVNRFLAIPWEGLPGGQKTKPKITAHHWQEGKLVLDLEYDIVSAHMAPGGSLIGENAACPVIAILNPATESWEVVRCPPQDIHTVNTYSHRTALVPGGLFTSMGGKIGKYDFPNRRWQDLDIPQGDDGQLYVVNGRLYCTSAGMISELTNDGTAARILASTRRQPPVSLLDTQDLSHPILFAGPDHSLRVSTGGKIFTWMGSDWREDFANPSVSRFPEVAGDGVIFCKVASPFDRVVSLSRLLPEAGAPELCLWQQLPATSSFQPTPGRNANPARQPLWMSPPEVSVDQVSATLHGAELYLLADHSVVQKNPGDPSGKVAPRDGYHVAVLRYLPGQASPQKIHLKFKDGEGCPPAVGMDTGYNTFRSTPSPAWMLFAKDRVFFGVENSESAMVNGVEGLGYSPGVWMMPLSELETGANNQSSGKTP